MPDKPETLEEAIKNSHLGDYSQEGAWRRRIVAVLHECGLLPLPIDNEGDAEKVVSVQYDPERRYPFYPGQIIPQAEWEAWEEKRRQDFDGGVDFPADDPTPESHICAPSEHETQQNSRICDKLYTEATVLEAMEKAAQALATWLHFKSDWRSFSVHLNFPEILSDLPPLNDDTGEFGAVLVLNNAAQAVPAFACGELLTNLPDHIKGLVAERDGLKAACDQWLLNVKGWQDKYKVAQAERDVLKKEVAQWKERAQIISKALLSTPEP